MEDLEFYLGSYLGFVDFYLKFFVFFSVLLLLQLICADMPAVDIYLLHILRKTTNLIAYRNTIEQTI